MAMSPRTLGILETVLALVTFAPGALFKVTLAPDVPGVEFAAIRLAIAAAVVFPIVLATTGFGAVPRTAIPRLLLYGILAGIHFGAFITSLDFTSIAHALTLCYTAPLWAAVFSPWILGERPTARTIAGVATAAVGIAVLVGFEPALNSRVLFGDALGLLSGAMLGLYHLVGRKERDAIPLFPYVAIVYAGAALFLCGFAGIARFGFDAVAATQHHSWTGLLGILGSAILPTVIGHTLVNDALRRTDAVTISLITTQEVTLGTLLGVLVQHQTLAPSTILGMTVALAGIALVVSAGETRPRESRLDAKPQTENETPPEILPEGA